MRRSRAPERGIAFLLAAALSTIGAAHLNAQGNPFTSNRQSTAQAAPRAQAADPALVRVQMDLRDRMAEAFAGWKGSRSAKMLWAVLGAAFLYGFLHALGPGHRKTVVFSVYLARRAPALEPLLVGLGLSALHAGSSIAVMAALKGAAGALSGVSADISVLMEGVSWSILVLASMALLAHALVEARKRKPAEDRALGIGALLLSGIYPCPGAMLVLILSLNLGLEGLGVAAVGSMSLGMSLPIVASGYLAWLGRIGLFMGLKKRERAISLLSLIVELSGYALLFAFSLFMALPFILGLFRQAA